MASVAVSLLRDSWSRQPSSRRSGKPPLGRETKSRVGTPWRVHWTQRGAGAQSSSGRWHHGRRLTSLRGSMGLSGFWLAKASRPWGTSSCVISPEARVSQAAGEGVSWEWAALDLLSGQRGARIPRLPVYQLSGG